MRLSDALFLYAISHGCDTDVVSSDVEAYSRKTQQKWRHHLCCRFDAYAWRIFGAFGRPYRSHKLAGPQGAAADRCALAHHRRHLSRGAYAILLCRTRDKGKVTESSIKEAMDEIPMGLGYFRQNGVSMLINRRMADISEIVCGKVLMNYEELSDMLEGRSDWKETEDVYRLPAGSACRYVEDELVTAAGERFRVAYFYDVTKLVRRKKELDAQNEELRMMSVQNRRLRENVGQLAKEEEILFFKTKWHDTMGDGLKAICRTLLASLPENETDDSLRSLSDAITVIQRDNDDSDQRRVAISF